jgi:hypothetical protein
MKMILSMKETEAKMESSRAQATEKQACPNNGRSCERDSREKINSQILGVLMQHCCGKLDCVG